MNNLQDIIYKNIQDVSLQHKERNVLKLIKADIQKEKNKGVPDNIVLKIIKSYISGSEQMLVYLDPYQDQEKYRDNEYMIKVLSEYVPKMVKDSDIKEYILEHIDISQYESPLQAMRDIMKHFGSSANGNTVKDILLSMK